MGTTVSFNPAVTDSGQVTRRLVTRGAFIAVVGAIALIAVSWLVIPAILASDRGLDLTDEGLYLLSARELAGSVQWGFPFGWHTAPLYHLAGGDVAQFRSIGGLILVLVGSAFMTAAYLATAPERLPSILSNPVTLGEMMAWAGVGWAGSLLYYSALLRSPGYNWVNLVGLLIMATATLVWFRASQADATRATAAARIGAVIVVGAGCIFASVAKPTTPVFFVLLVSLILAKKHGVRSALRWFFGVVVSALATVGLAVAARLWPTNFLDFFVFGAVQPPWVREHTLGGAAAELLLTPAKFVFYLFRDGGIGGVVLAVVAGLLWIASFRLTTRVSLVRRAASGVMLLGSLWVANVSSLTGLRSPVDRWATYPETSLGLTFLLLLAAGARITKIIDNRRMGAAPSDTRQWPVWAMMASLPLIFGFGASHGVFLQATLAGVTVVAATLVLLPRDSVTAPLRYAIIAVAMIIVVAVMVDSHRLPYRIPAISENTTELVLVDDGKSTVLVDEETAHLVTGLQSLVGENGFEPGTPVLGMVWRWNTTIPYSLGATVPDSVFLTLWGWEGSLDVARFNLSREAETFPWADAWLVVSAFDSLSDTKTLSLTEGFTALEASQGLVFPDDYDYLGRVGDIEVYRPSGR